MRGFVKGDDGLVGALMSRVYGSADLFPDGPNDMYRPYQSINFVTAHDGFCLYDLVSYNERHNEANGHGGTDGSSDNLSWNCGWEGDEGAPPEVLALRMRQMKNFAALMMLSNGVPMIVAGDEFANTQRGNNNPYNQDNEITWLDWDRLDSHRDLYEFFKAMIALRKGRRSIARSRFWREDVTVVRHHRWARHLALVAQPRVAPVRRAVRRGRPVRDGQRALGAAGVLGPGARGVAPDRGHDPGSTRARPGASPTRRRSARR